MQEMATNKLDLNGKVNFWLQGTRLPKKTLKRIRSIAYNSL